MLWKMLVKKAADLICFVGGAFVFIYFLFDFGHGGGWGDAPYYCYSAPSRFGLALGASLVTLGFLRRWERE